MNPDYVAMARLRFQPRVIRTLEGRIERDREELYRIRNEIMHGREPAGRLKRMERTMVARIGKNTEKLGKLCIVCKRSLEDIEKNGAENNCVEK